MSPYLFNLILDEITRGIHKIIPNSMLIANDIGIRKTAGDQVGYKHFEIMAWDESTVELPWYSKFKEIIEFWC